MLPCQRSIDWISSQTVNSENRKQVWQQINMFFLHKYILKGQGFTSQRAKFASLQSDSDRLNQKLQTDMKSEWESYSSVS